MKDLKKIIEILSIPEFWCPSKKEQYRRQGEAILKWHKDKVLEAMDILDNVKYWDTCPQDMKDKIEQLQTYKEKI